MNDKAAFLISQFVGVEPSFEKIPQVEQQENYNGILSKTLNWYSANRDLSHSHKFFMTYCDKNQLKIRKDVPQELVGNTGFLCRMLSRGLLETPLIINKINEKYDVLKEWVPVRTKSATHPEEVVKKQSQIVYSDSIIQVFTDIDLNSESILHGRPSAPVVELSQLDTKDLRLVITYLKEVQKEYQGIDTLEPEYRACYPGKRIINKLLDYIEGLITRVNELLNAGKTPRVQKPIPPSKQVATMKCMKEYLEFKGLPLEKIVGAKAILLFNTKYRKIMFLEAKTTFICKGASFFEVEKWVCRTSRHPEVQLKDWMVLTKPQLRAALESIKGANSTPQIRMTEDTIFLREFR